jgi:hypothetical protein
LGIGIVFCTNCGHQIEGDSIDPQHGDDITDVDSAGDTIDPSGHGDIGSQAGGHGGIPGPDTTPPEQWAEQVDQPTVTGAIETGVPTGVDAGVPGSAIPASHGGGATGSQGDDAEPPEGLTDTKGLDIPYGEVPDRDTSAVGPTGSPRRPLPWMPLLILGVVIVLAAILGLFLLGDDDGNGGNGGNGGGSFEIDEDGTVGNYEYEPNPGYNLGVVIRNWGTEDGSLNGHDVQVTVHIDTEKRAMDTHTLTGPLTAGGTTSFDMRLETGGFDPGDEIVVTIKLRRNGGDTTVDTYTVQHVVAI